MITLEQLRARRSELLALAEQYKADNVRVFGSVARGEATDRSDVDLLVHFRPGASLFDLMDLQEASTTLLNTKVDVISDRGLSPIISHHILEEAQAL